MVNYTIFPGCLLTADYAAKIGADSYSKDAMGLVRYAEQVVASPTTARSLISRQRR